MEKCPKCGSTDFMRERRPDGYSICSECDYRGLSTEWIKVEEKEEEKCED